MWNDFSLDAATNIKEGQIFVAEPVSWSIKAGVQFKTSLMQAVT